MRQPSIRRIAIGLLIGSPSDIDSHRSKLIVDEVLTEVGKKRRIWLLPARVVMYFVMAIAIFRDRYEALRCEPGSRVLSVSN